jgi:chromosome segregation ATPase
MPDSSSSNEVLQLEKEIDELAMEKDNLNEKLKNHQSTIQQLEVKVSESPDDLVNDVRLLELKKKSDKLIQIVSDLQTKLNDNNSY